MIHTIQLKIKNGKIMMFISKLSLQGANPGSEQKDWLSISLKLNLMKTTAINYDKLSTFQRFLIY